MMGKPRQRGRKGHITNIGLLFMILLWNQLLHNVRILQLLHLDQTLTKEGCVEVVSRVLYTTDPNWIQEISDVWSVLTGYFTPQVNKSCSTHVHLKQVTDAAGLNFSYAKAAAICVAYWDPSVYHLLPEERTASEFCRSNVTHSGNGLTKSLIVNQGEPFETIFETIINFEETPSNDVSKMQILCDFLGKNKDFAWNFQNLCTAPAPRPAPTGTIEFRRPPGSTSAREILHWVTLGLSFVNGSLRLDDETHTMMAKSHIPVIGKVNMNKGILPKELSEWSFERVPCVNNGSQIHQNN